MLCRLYESLCMFVFHKKLENPDKRGHLATGLEMCTLRSCSVKVGNLVTNFIQCSRGVRQDWPLSPSLVNFSFHLDLVEQIDLQRQRKS